MSLLLHIIIVTYIKENIITKLQKSYSPPRNPRAGNKSPALFVKKPICTGDLSPARKIFIERPVKGYITQSNKEAEIKEIKEKLKKEKEAGIKEKTN